jgi:hypothetical protein
VRDVRNYSFSSSARGREVATVEAASVPLMIFAERADEVVWASRAVAVVRLGRELF